MGSKVTRTSAALGSTCRRSVSAIRLVSSAFVSLYSPYILAPGSPGAITPHRQFLHPFIIDEQQLGRRYDLLQGQQEGDGDGRTGDCSQRVPGLVGELRPLERLRQDDS